MMKFIVLAVQYLKGTASHLGTTKNLVREVVVGVMTALCIYLVLHFTMPPEPDVVGGLRNVLQTTLQNQHRADSLQAWIRVKEKQDIIDSLQYTIRQYEERDSLRANSKLTPVGAMQTIIGAIRGKKAK
ncbi:hypothetical protein GCM10028803_53140 [Larkinella knui]|uniref:Uncharacterized protein n=1 Tax=Larkinella knui TaxID=2025310 RepID=A0A3P1CGW2_9BACT|nr:hypothetical protein [Larkinella knui]RRB12480.1 hypothetical protein EHT87_19975 [Larkinella knui]